MGPNDVVIVWAHLVDVVCLCRGRRRGGGGGGVVESGGGGDDDGGG